MPHADVHFMVALGAKISKKKSEKLWHQKV